MRNMIYSLATAACMVALAPWQASALPLAPLSTTLPSAIEQAQYMYGGRNYCWYDNGWRGPGYYWCGYAMRRGYGWGGGSGWRGWGGGPPRHMDRGGPRMDRGGPPRMDRGGPRMDRGGPPRMDRGGGQPQRMDRGRQGGGGGGGGGIHLGGQVPNGGQR